MHSEKGSVLIVTQGLLCDERKTAVHAERRRETFERGGIGSGSWKIIQ